MLKLGSDDRHEVLGVGHRADWVPVFLPGRRCQMVQTCIEEANRVRPLPLGVELKEFQQEEFKQLAFIVNQVQEFVRLRVLDDQVCTEDGPLDTTQKGVLLPVDLPHLGPELDVVEE
jgi:hypothetical protein